MSKVSYANLKMKPDTSTSILLFQGTEVEIKNYLSAEDKYDLIMITLQKAEEDGIYNSFKLDVFFHLHLVYMYTNLSFTEKQKEDELKIYDTLESNGFIDAMLEVIPETEYFKLFDSMEEIIQSKMKYQTSAAAILTAIIKDLPKNAQEAANIVDSFDKNKYQAVIDFATAANGGRNIITNK